MWGQPKYGQLANNVRDRSSKKSWIYKTLEGYPKMDKWWIGHIPGINDSISKSFLVALTLERPGMDYLLDKESIRSVA